MLEWIRELTLHYTTPDIHWGGHRRHECDGGIILVGWNNTLRVLDTVRLYQQHWRALVLCIDVRAKSKLPTPSKNVRLTCTNQ